jgi:cephalosporin hydroxylase
MSLEGQRFGEDWFTRFHPLWNTILAQYQPKRYLEVGSYEGRSVCHVIDTCSVFGPMDVYCIDTWLGGVEHKGRDFVEVEDLFDRNVALQIEHAQNPVNLHKRKGLSHVELAKLIAEGVEKFDFIYIDGSHKAVDALTDGVMAFPLLKDGGVLIFDDYLAEHTEDQRLEYPKIAIHAFLEVYSNKFKRIEFRLDKPDQTTDMFGNLPSDKLYQVYLIKISS